MKFKDQIGGRGKLMMGRIDSYNRKAFSHLFFDSFWEGFRRVIL